MALWSPRAIASNAIRAVGVRAFPAGVASIRLAISCLLGGVLGEAAEPAIAPAATTTSAMVSRLSVRRIAIPFFKWCAKRDERNLGVWASPSFGKPVPLLDLPRQGSSILG